MVEFKTDPKMSRRINSTLVKGLSGIEGNNLRERIAFLTLERLQKLIPSYDALIKMRGIGEMSIRIIHETLVAEGFDGVPGYAVTMNPNIEYLEDSVRTVSCNVRLTGPGKQIARIFEIASWLNIDVELNPSN